MNTNECVSKLKRIKKFSPFFLGEELDEVIRAVQELQPVVRCKDCKHFRTFHTSSDGEEIRTCVGEGIVDLNYDDFCSKGERKDQ